MGNIISKNYNNKIIKNKENNYFEKKNNINENYMLPDNNNNIENYRLNSQHYIIRNVFKGDIFKNNDIIKLLKKGCNVLDVGCGTGIWILEMAFLYDECNFLGIDINTDSVPNKIKPINVDFLNIDILKGINLKENYYDIIHMRMMLLAIPNNKWDFIINELLNILKNNGYIQFIEMDINIYNINNHFYEKTLNKLKELNISINTPSLIKNIIKKYNEKINIVEDNFEKIPVGWYNYNMEYPLYEEIQNDIKEVWINTTKKLFNVNCNKEINQMIEECKLKKAYIKWHRIVIKKNKG